MTGAGADIPHDDLDQSLIRCLSQAVQDATEGLSQIESDGVVLMLASRLVESVAHDSPARWSAAARGEMLEAAARINRVAQMAAHSMHIRSHASDGIQVSPESR